MQVFVRAFLMCLLFALCFSQEVKATHIVGGDLTYRHIANDSFELTLVLYVDCFFGSPGAISLDATAMVGVFTSSGVFVKSMLEPRSLPVRINSVSLDCVVPPTNACVDQYIYKYYTRLPFLSGGYILAFQRCCRNNTIRNIVAPQSSGTTFWCNIPDSVFSLGYNTAAVFKTLPPNYLCANRYFSYDHSATDADGDSLSYELYTPYLGADEFNNRPLPPSAPPYPPVNWVTGYGVNSMMQGNPELSIDPVTGVISVKPLNSGQYVVGIAVKEFRNGKLINITRRDFQFNVFNCVLDVVSAFAKDIAACSDTVTFSNTSRGATAYFWDFGDTLSTTDTSTEFQPTFVYSRTGRYGVKLIASKGNCYDSLLVNVTIDKDIGTFAGNDTTICALDAVAIGAKDSLGFSYQWTPGLYLDNPSSPNPICTPPQSITYIVTRLSELCVNKDTVKVTVKKPQGSFSPGFIAGCRTATLLLDSVSSYPAMSWYLNGQPSSQQALQSRPYQYAVPVRIRLVAFDSVCYDTLEREVTPEDTAVAGDIPNVFTPNGDGINDCYRIENITLSKECSQLVVYNRWGRLVYNSDTDGECWNGSSGDSPLASGVYYYVLQHKGRNFHGTISLIR